MSDRRGLNTSQLVNIISGLNGRLIKETEKLNGDDFVHYTSAEAAFKIISGEYFWARNACLMNDSSEIKHGVECMKEAFGEGALIERMKNVLEEIEPGLFADVSGAIFSNLDNLLNQTYILSVSRHFGREDKLGRLSMWRAYSGRCGVALVLDSSCMNIISSLNGLSLCPVFYSNNIAIKVEIARIIKAVDQNKDSIKSMDTDSFRFMLVSILLNICMSSKHMGFREEAEWRAVYNPTLARGLLKYFRDGEYETVFVNGVPQRIYKVKINAPYIEECSIDRLIKKVIVGPSNDAEYVKRSFVDLLREKRVKEPESRVILSNIPLRH